MADIERITVELGERSYRVDVAEGLLGLFAELLPNRSWRKAALVTDSNVGPIYAQRALENLRGMGLETLAFEIGAGEESKTADCALEVIGWLITCGMTRSDVVVALGGGVVGDLAGFAASVFKRGIDLVQLPTTLMAQVDSAVGGKTAVNTPEAKNQVGTVHQPVAVLCDVTCLGTLPARELRAGFAEVAKYSFLTERAWGPAFRSTAGEVRALSPSELAPTIAECVREKAALVSADEFDRGVRHRLNYGHTLGHALEAEGGYSAYLHGEAISVGMIYAALVSEELGIGRGGLAADHRALLASLGLPTTPAGRPPDFSDLLARMAQDKKSDGGNVMVLLETEGKPVVKSMIEGSVLEGCYQKLIAAGAPGQGQEVSA